MAAKSGESYGWVPMVGPDEELDESGNRPTNVLSAKCKHCSFPDLDFVAKPYLLARGIASPAESWAAKVGNFLVRERVRRILELAVPKACDFFPTAELKSKKATPWSLGVPKRVLAMPGLKLRAEGRCSKCKEPKCGYHFYEQGRLVALKRCDCAGVDVFKSREWLSVATLEDHFAEANKHRKQGREPLLEWSEFARGDDVDPPKHKERWTRLGLSRELFFSVRLAQLWKQAKVKGQLVVSWNFKDFAPAPEDKAWVEEKMALLAAEGLVDAPARAAKKSDTKVAKKSAAAGNKPTGDAEKWFRQYLKANAKQKPAAADFAAVEKKHKVKLPKSYKDFIKTVGSKKFNDVNATDGFVAKVLPPQRLNFREYRRGMLEDTDEESAEVDGVMFAVTEHGDCFVFDVAVKGNDYPVYHYDHELNAMQPWSGSFGECIKRFAEQN